MINRGADFYSVNAFIKILCIVGIYLFFSFLIIGFKADQLILSAIFLTGYFSSITGRKFILAFSIFIVYWILFDYMKAFPNYVHNKYIFWNCTIQKNHYLVFIKMESRLLPMNFGCPVLLRIQTCCPAYFIYAGYLCRLVLLPGYFLRIKLFFCNSLSVSCW